MGSNAKSGYIERLPSGNIEMEFGNFFSLVFSPVIPLLHLFHPLLPFGVEGVPEGLPPHSVPLVIPLLNIMCVFMTVAGQTKICDVEGMRCLGKYSGKS
jgi:hypothetical protein